MSWYPSEMQTAASRGRRAVRKGWATIRWGALVAACGLGVAGIIGALVVGLAALVQNSG
jgi:hypothetical protein